VTTYQRFPSPEAVPGMVGVTSAGNKAYLRVNAQGMPQLAPPRYKKEDLLPIDEAMPSELQMIYIGGTGDVYAVCPISGSTLSFLSVPDGTFINGPFSHVTSSTTALGMVGFFAEDAVTYSPGIVEGTDEFVDSDADPIVFFN
jgi:hypothetical protein